MSVLGIPAEGIRFRTLVGLAMQMHGYAPEHYIRCADQLKYLQRQKAAPRRSVGRGRTILYSQADVCQNILALELHMAGFAPMQIKPLLGAYIAEAEASIIAGEELFMAVAVAGRRIVYITIPCAAIRANILSYFGAVPSPTQVAA